MSSSVQFIFLCCALFTTFTCYQILTTIVPSVIEMKRSLKLLKTAKLIEERRRKDGSKASHTD